MEDKELDWKERRLKLWLGFAKFILGTFIIGMFVQWINWQIQSRQLEIKEQEAIGQFLDHALKEDVGVRLRFAHYFSTVTRSDKLRTLWVDYRRIVQREADSLQAQKSGLEIRAENTEDRAEKELLLGKIAELEQALSAKPSSEAVNNWFTVLASYRENELPILDEHAAKLNALLRRARLPYTIDVYKTRISGNFVITVGGRMSKVEANALAAKAKLEKWAADAFPQIDREWSIVKSYPSSP